MCLNKLLLLFICIKSVRDHWADIVISIGALCGITSVLLVSFFGQSRVFFAMSRDGLLPEFFSRLHKDFRTPTNGIVIVGIFASVLCSISTNY